MDYDSNTSTFDGLFSQLKISKHIINVYIISKILSFNNTLLEYLQPSINKIQHLTSCLSKPYFLVRAIMEFTHDVVSNNVSAASQKSIQNDPCNWYHLKLTQTNLFCASKACETSH